MLIGIDMLAVQVSGEGNHEAGRYGRQLVDRILARNTADHFLLYTHDGWPLDQIPSSSRRVTRRSVPSVPALGPSGLRATIQRLLDGNPDGLDWIVLLDPFSPHYGAVPPESPLGPLKVAAVVHDLHWLKGDDRSLAPLRRFEAIFAVAGTTAAQCRLRLGSASSRVATLNVAADPVFAAPAQVEPLSSSAGHELGRLGIKGPFFFHVAGRGASQVNLEILLDIYARLPVEHRHRYQLVVAGEVNDPGSLQQSLARRGIVDGLVLAGEVGIATLRTLYGRCSAYLSPTIDEGSGLPLIEAMLASAPVIAGRSGTQAEIVGDAGLLVDPLDPAEVAAELAELIANPDLEHDLRARSVARASTFTWEPAVEAVLAVLADGQTPAATATAATGAAITRYRADADHSVRPRIAYFLGAVPATASPLDLAGQIPGEWLDRYNIDFYFESDQAALADQLAIDFGGFDVRLFDRNDSLLGYHAVVYRVTDARHLPTTTRRLVARPGLVLLEDDAFLDAILSESVRSAGPTDQTPRATLIDPSQPMALRSDFALAQVRGLIRTGSSLVVRSPRHFDVLHEALGEQAEAITLVPLDVIPLSTVTATRRASSRARLDLVGDPVVVGQFAALGAGLDSLLSPRAFQAIHQDAPDVVFLGFGADLHDARDRIILEARNLGLSDRYLLVPAVEADQVADVVALLDLAIHPGGTSAGLAIVNLFRAGVATLVSGGDSTAGTFAMPTRPSTPRTLARLVRNLVQDAQARATLGQSGRDYVLGVADPAAAASLQAALIERCAHELPRAVGRRVKRSGSGSSRRVLGSPHFSLPASVTTEAAHGRGAP